MDLVGIQGIFYDERIRLVQAQLSVSDGLAGSTASNGSFTGPSTVLVWPGSFRSSLTLWSDAFTYKNLATGDPL